MTKAEARALLDAKRHKRKIKSAAMLRLRIISKIMRIMAQLKRKHSKFVHLPGGIIVDMIQHRDENPIDILPENLTANTIINLGQTLSQRNTERRQRHAVAWNTIFAAAVDAYMWQVAAASDHQRPQLPILSFD
ncbi:hypothetical protein V1504DRAFT_471223 [Lipomyces starkeyi]